MTVYYNENDPKIAAWLRNLIVNGYLPRGDVDERSIEDVRPSDLIGYKQCHFFAGIGGWPLALQRAGWPEDRPVWTGSCPCQPYSSAGARSGNDDPRALWWAWRWLIEQCQPTTIFGEQVASKAGRAWLAGVQADLEALGYRTGAADLCAAGVGAPHVRQRLWWMGQPSGQGTRRDGGAVLGEEEAPPLRAVSDGAGDAGTDSGLSNASSKRPQASERQELCGEERNDKRGAVSELCGTQDPWNKSVWINCADGKARRIKPGTAVMAHGISNRVAKLRGIGNAIVPQVAEQFIRSYMECEQ